MKSNLRKSLTKLRNRRIVEAIRRVIAMVLTADIQALQARLRLGVQDSLRLEVRAAGALTRLLQRPIMILRQRKVLLVLIQVNLVVLMA